MSVTHVDLFNEKAAYSVLNDHKFLMLWQTLHGACPHATAFQAPSFVRVWYETYRAQWQPVVVQSQDSDGNLVGLWLLAHNPITGVITHAGAHQAEYHTWLALPGNDVPFLSSAWAALTRHFTFKTLRFKYLPAAALGSTLQTALGILSGGVVVRKYSRPVLNISSDEIKISFAKKSNKSRFNRLKRLDKLEFRHLKDPVELERVFDELILFYDFRQAAINHSIPFREDPQKRKFHKDLFSNVPNNVYVTVTYLGKHPIAAFWGLVSGKTVHLGMLIHSPLYAKHSPGKLHIMQLSEHLLKDGKNMLDLTPGGDTWKERFTNAHDEVAEAIIYRSKWARIQTNMLDGLSLRVKLYASKVGITPVNVRSTLAMFFHVRTSAVIQKIRNWVSVDCESRIYRCDKSLVESCHFDKRVRCNSLSDLLSFDPGKLWQIRDEFLRNALARLERGELAYTISKNGHLVHSGWMVKHQTEFGITEIKQSMQLPPGSIVFYDLYACPDFRCQDNYRAVISHMLSEAFTEESTQYVYISILTNNLSLRYAVETMNFEYQGSFFLKSRFGAERKWASPMLANSKTTYA